MKRANFKTVVFVLLFLLKAVDIKAQRRNKVNEYDSNYLRQLEMYFDLFRPPRSFDINRLPINICFIEKDSRYVGFIVAGHASKDACQVASLRIKNFLDSFGYTSNTVFSFGVGFDLCGSRDSLQYDRRLKYLEKVFESLQKQYLFEVKVSHVPDSVFKNLSNKLRDNAALALNTIKSKESVNRIIFRYDIDSLGAFPIPVPFYTKDSIVRFVIAKKDIGNIPKADIFNSKIIDDAIKEMRYALSTNKTALVNLRSYKPDEDYSRFAGVPYTINYYDNGKPAKKDLTVPGVTSIDDDPFSYSASKRYWSLPELNTKCNSGEGKTIRVKGQSEKITPCEALRIIKSNIIDLVAEKDRLIENLVKITGYQESDLNKVIEFKRVYRQNASSGDSVILIDAFLRGWCFKSDDKIQAARFFNWYQKRKSVWEKIMTNNEDFRKRIDYKPGVKIPGEIIAGIFHSDDVFFSIVDSGKNYVITPYKMLGGNFIQVIDKENSICQFLSENNFRLLKL